MPYMAISAKSAIESASYYSRGMNDELKKQTYSAYKSDPIWKKILTMLTAVNKDSQPVGKLILLLFFFFIIELAVRSYESDDGEHFARR